MKGRDDIHIGKDFITTTKARYLIRTIRELQQQMKHFGV
jgi:hypothetical protein